MELPNSFIENIANAFYDKDVKIYYETVIQDAEGGKIRSVGAQKGTAKVNISYSRLEAQAKEYGLEMSIDATITCRPGVLVIGDILGYNGKNYKVVGLIPYDSHQKAAIKLL